MWFRMRLPAPSRDGAALTAQSPGYYLTLIA